MPRKQTMNLFEYLDGMRSARDASELEAAIHAPYKHSFRGKTWTQICNVRIEAGRRIVAAHPHSFYIPSYVGNNVLACCGQTIRVKRGTSYQAGLWVQSRLRDHGFGIRAAYRLWENNWYDYPHRCIAFVEDVLQGKVPDPELGRLIKHAGHAPISYTIEQNERDVIDRRAHQRCECGGDLFEWGGGYDSGFYFVSWHCNKCSDVFTEYRSKNG